MRGPGTLYHRAEWMRVFAAYGLPTFRLTANCDGRITGILPLVWQRAFLLRNQLVSLPWFDSAGVLADDEQTQTALLEAADKLTQRMGARSIEIRQLEPISDVPSVRLDKLLMRLPLDPDSGAMWDRFRPTVRNQIRKAQNSDLTVRSGGSEFLRDFHSVYAHNMRDLGSPPHSLKFFDTVLSAFPNESRISIVHRFSEPVAAALTMNNGDRLEVPWASSLKRYNPLCVNHLLYWHLIDDACRAGLRWLQFGRSTRDSGTYRFKKQWGAEPVQLYWHSTTPTSGSSDEQLSTPPKSYRMGAKVWKRLPQWLSRSFGPHVIAKLS